MNPQVPTFPPEDELNQPTTPPINGAPPDDVPTDVAPQAVPVKSHSQPPLDAGRLSVNADGTYATAANPGDGRAYVITLGAKLSAKAIDGLAERAGKAALDAEHAYFTLPQSGQIAKVSLADAQVLARFEACTSPEGVAVQAGIVSVACREGTLAELDANDGRVLRRAEVADDLRDVLAIDGGLALTRFASAELLILNEARGVAQRLLPPAEEGLSEPGVAWETIVTANGDLLMAHQTASEGDLSFGYSGGDCASVAAPTITRFHRDPSTHEFVWAGKIMVSSAAGVVDIAERGNEYFMATPGNGFAVRQAQIAGLVSGSPVLLPPASSPPDPSVPTPVQRIPQDAEGCHFQQRSGPEGDPLGPMDTAGVPVSVATVPGGAHQGKMLFLSQFPAKAWLFDVPESVVLNDEDVEDTGFELFHMSVGTGVSCASCHPLGRVDARVWRLARGMRRTQSLEGGVSAHGAFHWDGEFSTFETLVEDVLTHRMGGSALDAPRQAALLGFVDSIPPPSAASATSPEAVARGEAIFHDETVACAHCHSGPLFTDNLRHDVGSQGAFVTPSLRGVRYRAPYLHDGCAPDLMGRFSGCGSETGRHGAISHLSAADLQDLVSYMQTL